MSYSSFFSSLARKRHRNHDTSLRKYLGTFELISIGVGSTIGLGIFLLSGLISKSIAGPGAIVSFTIAAFASFLSGLCFSEFGTRIPRAGSSYACAVTILGELPAFLIGCHLLQEYTIASATVAKTVSGYIDAVSGNATSEFLRTHLPLNVSFLDEYVDVVAFGVVVVISLALAFGTTESAIANNFFVLIKLSIFVFIIGVTCFKFDINNWEIPREKVPQQSGIGGFFPFGFFGVMRGAGMCFSAFAGFQAVLTAAEEAKNPKKSMPIAVLGTLVVCFLVYVSITACLTLIVPYYDLDAVVPLSKIFDQLGYKRTFQVITTFSIFGLFSSLISTFFALPRILLTMAEDGLLFRVFRVVSPKFGTPVWGILISGLVTGLIAAFVKTKHLMSLISVGSLISFTAIAICVILIRYEVANDDNVIDRRIGFFKILFNVHQFTIPTRLSTKYVMNLTFLLTGLCFAFSIYLRLLSDGVIEASVKSTSPLVILIIAIFVSLYAIASQPVSQQVSSFSVPLVPWIPALSILINVFLLVNLGHKAMMRFVVGTVAALVLYFIYSRRESKIERQLEGDHDDVVYRPIDAEVL